MDIQTVTIPHPNLNKRDITLLMVNGNIDILSTKFLIYEARYGGRHGSIGGKTSHAPKAFQIAELYRHLNDMGLDWRTANEEDIKRIRNAMLCWDLNDNLSEEDYPYEPISRDSMNHKLNTWFKFYKYMEKINEPFDITLTTRKVKKYRHKRLLDHLNKRYSPNDEVDYIDSWTLKVKPSPKSHTYHALTRTEFSKLRKHLRDIDIVYEMIALLMVETGLRRAAALEAKENDLRSWLKHINAGKTINDVIKCKYIPKGGDEPYEYDLPIRTMSEINENYLMRIFPQRQYDYEQRCVRLDKEIKNEVLWITKRGKEVKKHDINEAFDRASKLMGRTNKNITPHWLRHTFATWTIMDVAKVKGIPLENTGTTPNPLLLLALQQKLGHADAMTTMRYIATALKLMGLDLNDGPIKISLRTFKRDKKAQELVKDEAKIEFREHFNDDYFDVIKYAISRGIVIDDELVLEKH
jgi:integrase